MYKQQYVNASSVYTMGPVFLRIPYIYIYIMGPNLVGTYHTGAKIKTPSRINFRADFHQKSLAWGGEGRTQQKLRFMEDLANNLSLHRRTAFMFALSALAFAEKKSAYLIK